MAYSKIKVVDAPKRPRKSVSRFEATDDWHRMKADMDKGLKPGEALQVVFSEQDKEEYNITSRRTIARFIKKYISTRDLPYAVKSFERREAGDFYILVEHVPARRR